MPVRENEMRLLDLTSYAEVNFAHIKNLLHEHSCAVDFEFGDVYSWGEWVAKAQRATGVLFSNTHLLQDAREFESVVLFGALMSSLINNPVLINKNNHYLLGAYYEQFVGLELKLRPRQPAGAAAASSGVEAASSGAAARGVKRGVDQLSNTSAKRSPSDQLMSDDVKRSHLDAPMLWHAVGRLSALVEKMRDI